MLTSIVLTYSKCALKMQRPEGVHENCTIMRVLLDTLDTYRILFNKITYYFMLTFTIMMLITRGNSLGPDLSSFL